MRVLVWQWGRRGAGPQVAAAMARGLGAVAGVETRLSLSTGAEMLLLPWAPENDVPVHTYADRTGFALRVAASPWMVPAVARAVRESGADVALCAMPAPLDFTMAAALRRAGVPYAVVVHDAQRHPGDIFPTQMTLQRRLLRGAGMLFALTTHVADQLRGQGMPPGQRLVLASHPPFVFGPMPRPAGGHNGRFRLLSFGRLLPYKGLDLLGEALMRLGGRDDLEIRVVGSGPDSSELARLRALPNVTVENRWVPEWELASLLAWADGLVLSHREASQSGVAAAAIAARRWVVATRVGGLAEQLDGEAGAVLCEADPESLAAAIGSLPARGPPEVGAMPNWSASAEAIVGGLRGMMDERRLPSAGDGRDAPGHVGGGGG